VFASHRPAEMKQPDSPFFPAINWRRKPELEGPLGKNEIGKFIFKAANFPVKISNHSFRKTFILWMDAEVPENYVAQLSAHKNLTSLHNYNFATASHQRKTSFA
ncbi:zinc finger MYM-type 2-like, partial, partial [Paramuricea clavata]